MNSSIKNRKFFDILLNKKMLALAALGFSSGVPFMITKDVLKAWFTDAKIDLATIGLFSAISFPYTFKFLWAPAMDRIVPPFLGRRRGWIIVTQILLMIFIASLGTFSPTSDMRMITLAAIAIAFFSASQDIVLDAYRRETLSDHELGLGTGIWVNLYRFANLATVGVAFALADKIGYQNVFYVLSLMMLVGVFATLLTPEPLVEEKPPRNFQEAVVAPLKDFFSKQNALWVLLFILLFKIGDNMASAMNIPFILSLGFQKTDYFIIVKGVGMGALFLGMFLGGAWMVRLGIEKSLMLFGILQMISTLGFAALQWTGSSSVALSIVVVFELLTSGLGTTAYSAFMASQTNKKFTATQYALLTSLMAVPGTFVAATTGFLAQNTGWTFFYIICSLSALPGLFLIKKLKLTN